MEHMFDVLVGLDWGQAEHRACVLDASGEVLRPAILWNDGRSGDACAALEAAVPESRGITGNLAMPGFTAPKLYWLRENEPEIHARTACVLLPKDWIRLRLTNERHTDYSDASGTLWLDVGARNWSDPMQPRPNPHVPARFGQLVFGK